MDFESLIIKILEQWAKDCFDCAKTLNEYYYKTTDYKTILLCCAQPIATRGLSALDLTYKIIMFTKHICFSDLMYISMLFGYISEHPQDLINTIWKECENLCPIWDDYFGKYKERLLSNYEISK